MPVPIRFAFTANATHDPEWARWVDRLPALVTDLIADWQLRPDGETLHGRTAVVLPVRAFDDRSAVLKVGFPRPESAPGHLALRYWAGNGAVELLRADPHRNALLLERLETTDLTTAWDLDACEIVGGLYARLHIPAPPQLRSLPDLIRAETVRLRGTQSTLPRRLVDQAIALGTDLADEPGSVGTLIHTDLHYANVLAAAREPWLAIGPKPLSGDPHYELAPMLWNRWDEVEGQVRAAVRRRFDTLVDAAGLDEDRARAWVLVRMVHLATEPGIDRDWVTTCVAVAKAVQG